MRYPFARWKWRVLADADSKVATGTPESAYSEREDRQDEQREDKTEPVTSQLPASTLLHPSLAPLLALVGPFLEFQLELAVSTSEEAKRKLKVVTDMVDEMLRDVRVELRVEFLRNARRELRGDGDGIEE